MRCGTSTLDLNQKKPFANLPERHELTAYVDRFTWLADLKATRDAGAHNRAINLLEAWWLQRASSSQSGEDMATTITRLRTCLANGDLILNDCALTTFDQFGDLIARDIAALEAEVQNPTADLNTKARALLALTLAGLVLDGCEDLTAAHEPALATNLEGAVRADGSPASRARSDAIDLVLDLIPVIRMYGYVERPLPTALTSARQRAVRFLKTLHISGAAFVSFGSVDGPADLNIARVLKLEAQADPHEHAENQGVVRLEAERFAIFADIGGPELANTPAAGRASVGAIEIAFAHRHVIATREGRAATDGVPQHQFSGLVLDPRDPGAMALASPIATHGDLSVLDRNETAVRLAFEHARYLESHGLMHGRTIEIATDGSAVTGHERLYSAQSTVRFSRDVPFSLQFHLAPDIRPSLTGTAGEIALALPEGDVLVFSSTDGQVSVESQTDVAPDGSQRTALLIAVRGTTHGEADVRWRLAVQH